MIQRLEPTRMAERGQLRRSDPLQTERERVSVCAASTLSLGLHALTLSVLRVFSSLLVSESQHTDLIEGRAAWDRLVHVTHENVVEVDHRHRDAFLRRRVDPRVCVDQSTGKVVLSVASEQTAEERMHTRRILLRGMRPEAQRAIASDLATQRMTLNRGLAELVERRSTAVLLTSSEQKVRGQALRRQRRRRRRQQQRRRQRRRGMQAAHTCGRVNRREAGGTGRRHTQQQRQRRRRRQAAHAGAEEAAAEGRRRREEAAAEEEEEEDVDAERRRRKRREEAEAAAEAEAEEEEEEEAAAAAERRGEERRREEEEERRGGEESRWARRAESQHDESSSRQQQQQQTNRVAELERRGLRHCGKWNLVEESNRRKKSV